MVKVKSIHNIESIIRSSPYFQNASRKAIKELLSMSKIMFHARSSFILNAADVVSEFLFVLDGRVNIYMQSNDGRNLIIDICRAGTPFCIAPLFTQHPGLAHAQAQEDSIILHTRREAFLNFLQHHPSLALNFLKIRTDRLNTMIIRLRHAVTDKASYRILYTLQQMNRRLGNTLNVSIEEIGQFAGTAPETVRRLIKQLKAEDILTFKRGEINILNPTALHNFRIK